MALIGNYNVLNKSCGASYGGVNQAATRAARNTSNQMRGFAVGVDRDYAALPNGTSGSASRLLARKSGGIACYTGTKGAATVSNGVLAGGLNADAALTGSGGITVADVVYAISAQAALTGSSTLTVSMEGIWDMIASIGGTGFTTADANAIADAIAELNGSAGMTAAMRGDASMSAAITVTGELLTTSNVGSAVRQTIQPDLDQLNTGIKKTSLGIPYSGNIAP